MNCELRIVNSGIRYDMWFVLLAMYIPTSRFSLSEGFAFAGCGLRVTGLVCGFRGFCFFFLRGWRGMIGREEEGDGR